MQEWWGDVVGAEAHSGTTVLHQAAVGWLLRFALPSGKPVILKLMDTAY